MPDPEPKKSSSSGLGVFRGRDKTRSRSRGVDRVGPEGRGRAVSVGSGSGIGLGSFFRGGERGRRFPVGRQSSSTSETSGSGSLQSLNNLTPSDSRGGLRARTRQRAQPSYTPSGMNTISRSESGVRGCSPPIDCRKTDLHRGVQRWELHGGVLPPGVVTFPSGTFYSPLWSSSSDLV